MKIGIYDALEEQDQDYYSFDLYQSHLAIFGGAMSGKTTILKTILIRIHQLLANYEEEIYVLDFNSALQSYHSLPLVKAWFDASNEENVRRMFGIISNKLSENKNLLSSKNFVQSDNQTIKHITFIIDGINAFFSEEKFSAYHDELKRITRDGLSKGVTVIFTANDTSGGVNRILSYFNRVIALDLQKDKYIELFSTRVDKPIIAKGRGIANIDTKVYEFQAFFPYNMNRYDFQKDEKAEENALDAFIMELKCVKSGIDFDYLESHKLQSFSGSLTKEKWESLVDDPDATPVITPGYLTAGIDYLEFKPIRIDLKTARTIAIYGKKGGGKTNLLTLLLLGLKQLDSFKLVVWDDNSGTLKKDFCDFFDDIRINKPDTTVKDIKNREKFIEFIQTEYRIIIPNNMYDSVNDSYYYDDYPPSEPHSPKQPNINLFAYPSEDVADDDEENKKDINLVFSMFFSNSSNKQVIEENNQQDEKSNQSENLLSKELQHEDEKIMSQNDNTDGDSDNIDESIHSYEVNDVDESNNDESSENAVFSADDKDDNDESENTGEDNTIDQLDNTDEELIDQKPVSVIESNAVNEITDSGNSSINEVLDDVAFKSDYEDDNDESRNIGEGESEYQSGVDNPNTLDKLLDSVIVSINNKPNDTDIKSDSKYGVEEADDLGEDTVDDSDNFVFDFGDANNDNTSDETEDEYEAEYSKLDEECEFVDNGEVFDYDKNTENHSTNEQKPVNKVFTVFLIQSRQFYQTVAGRDGNQLAERLSSFFEHDATNNTLFVFCDTQQLQRKETQEYFNAYINHAFLLNDIVRFVNDKGQRSVFGSEDVKELKERFGSFELGDGYYFDRQTEELKKMKFIDSQSLS